MKFFILMFIKYENKCSNKAINAYISVYIFCHAAQQTIISLVG